MLLQRPQRGGPMKQSLRLVFSLLIIVVVTAILFTFLHDPKAWRSFPLLLIPRSWRTTLSLELLQALVIAIATYLIVRWDLTTPIRRSTEWLKNLRLGGVEETLPPRTEGLFAPLAREVT